MRDVSDILAKRLLRLESPFSRDWLSDFSNLMEFIQTNPLTTQVVELIREKKEEAHASLIHHLKALLEDGKKCLQQIETRGKSLNELRPQIQALLAIKIDRKKTADPFFELESIYFDYYNGFVSLLKAIAQDDANVFVSEYCILACIKLQEEVYLNIDLTFSPFLQKCKQDIEILAGQRTNSMWGKWDLLLKWNDWTKNGISPGNQAFERNLSNLFKGLNISKSVQNCGLFFIERLASMKTVITDCEISLKALELYLDAKEQYWIITHIADGETVNKEPYFIKKLQQSTRSYEFLKLLMDAEPYSFIDFDKLTHTLGELEIKKELKKVFFPQDKFAGSVVHLSEIDFSINGVKILDHLSAIKKAKINRPSFHWGQYFNTSAIRS